MKTKKAYLAGGCFWWMEELFRAFPWIMGTRVGYMGWETENPTYRNHAWHAEALEIEYDADEIDYSTVLDYFFRIHDPTTLNQQGNDRGDSYRSAIFFEDDEQLQTAEDFIKIVNDSGRWPNPVVTSLEEFEAFYLAEDYHQDYLQKSPNWYTCHYVRWPTYITS